jgi:hypothetical protein
MGNILTSGVSRHTFRPQPLVSETLQRGYGNLLCRGGGDAVDERHGIVHDDDHARDWHTLFGVVCSESPHSLALRCLSIHSLESITGHDK